jgi:hypothetical protein
VSDGYCKCGMWERDCRCDEDSGQECATCGYPATWGEVADGTCPECWEAKEATSG